MSDKNILDAFVSGFRNAFIALLVIFLGPPMLVAELIMRRTIRWRSLPLFHWCLAFWGTIILVVWWLL